VRCIARRLLELEERLDGFNRGPDEKAPLVSASDLEAGGKAADWWSGVGGRSRG
jgi:hypothetical protein